MTFLPIAFFSNQVELLYQRLKERLFTSSHPFTKRLIIVPSPAMKSWLMLRMARDPSLNVALGLEIGYADQSIQDLCHWMEGQSARQARQNSPPTPLEIALALEIEICSVLQNYDLMDEKEHQLWAFLIRYLQFSSGALTSKQEKRIVSLCRSLANLFVEYAKFGKEMLVEWTAEKNVHWQQELWQRLEKKFEPWNYPVRYLETFSFPEIQRENLQIHLFAMSFISPLHHRFLMRLGEKTAVSYYLLSPCQKFWSDLLSDREAQRSKKYWKKLGVSDTSRFALEEYLRDVNPLLANFGRLGREMALQIENSRIQSQEDYILPGAVQNYDLYQEWMTDQIQLSESKQPLTLLEAIQSDILLLRNPETSEKIFFENYDESVQVHMATTPMREVQIVYQALLKIIDRHAHDLEPITPSDILIMAPAIMQYEPFIKSVFGGNKSQIDYQLMDLQMPAKSPLVQAFLHLLQLPFSRWEASVFLQLIEYPSFQNRLHLNLEEVQTIRNWIKTTGIRWGQNKKHRNLLLQRDGCQGELLEGSEGGTWEFGLERLFRSFIEGDDDSEGNSIHFETAQVPLLGKFAQILRSLFEDLKPLSDGSLLSLSDWSIYLKCLHEAYFKASIEEEDIYRRLIGCLDAFNSAEKTVGSTEKFSFTSIKKHLESALNEQTVSYRESHLQTVKFCSLMPMRALPAKVIVLLGMKDGVFPRQNDDTSLNMMLSHAKCDYYPSKTDFDRYLFLEALLSTRRYFVLTYVGLSAADPKELAPSVLVQELLTYLNSAYQIQVGQVSDFCLYKHPFFPFDQAYFCKNSRFASYSIDHYQQAVAYYKREKTSAPSFIPHFEPLTETVAYGSEVIDLKDLIQFARNPFKQYFNKTLGIYLEKAEDRITKTEENFLLSPLDRSKFSLQSLQLPFEAILKILETEGTLQGPFKKLDLETLKSSTEELRDFLSHVGISPNSQFVIEFCPDCKEPQKEPREGILKIPALVFKKEFATIKLTGRLENVTTKGILAYIEARPSDFAKAWPTLLAFSLALKHFSLSINQQVICLKDPSVMKIDFIDPIETMQAYIDCYFKSLQNPCPLLPEWVPQLLSLPEEEFKKSVEVSTENSFRPIYNEYLNWLLRGSTVPECRSIYENWKAVAIQIYGNDYQNMFPDLQKEAKP